jgi:NAD(P)-dependent dehydrogenase (short-subunit alcohol dehydrogenase family)
VTGGTRNIGAAIALALGHDGHDVALVGRSSSPEGEALVDRLEAMGVRATARACDVSRPDEVRALQEGLAADGFVVDILVNNASQRPHQPFLEITEEDWRSVQGVTLDGAFRCSQAVLPAMVARRWGRIINLIGVRGQNGGAERAHLVAAKSGLIGLTKALAHEFGPSGVTVNAISPGTIVTDRDRQDPSRLERRRGVGVLDRFGAPEDVAAAVAFLAGDSAGFVTGQVIGVNGGEHM